MIRCHIVFRQCFDVDSFFSETILELLICLIRINLQQEMQSGVIFNDFAVPVQLALSNAVQHPLPLPAVVQTHPVDVLFKISLPYKRRKGILLKIGDRTRIERQLIIESIGQIGRQNHVADADGRCQRLGKRIHIDHLFTGVNAEQRRNRFSVRTKFAVVVVLNDDSPLLFIRPCEHFVSSARRHGNTGGKMMGRTDVRNLCTRLPQSVNRNAVFIHLSKPACDIVLTIDSAQLLVSRILDAVAFVPAEQLDDQTVQIFRSSADDDLIGIHQHPAEGLEMFDNRSLELVNPAGRRRLHQRVTASRDGLPDQAGVLVRRTGSASLLMRIVTSFMDTSIVCELSRFVWCICDAICCSGR